MQYRNPARLKTANAMWFAAVCLLIPMILAGCGRSELDGMAKGETGRVMRILSGDAFVLEGGQSVRLVGIDAPDKGRDGDEDDPYAEASLRALESLVLGRQVDLYYPGITRDRYGRALAHAVVTDEAGRRMWVNREMLLRGGARLRVYADTDLGYEQLYDAEQAARKTGEGLWGDAAYRVHRPRELNADSRGLFLVSLPLPVSDVRYLIDQRDKCVVTLASDTTMKLESTDIRVCDVLQAAEDGELEVRGWARGLELSVDHVAHVRVIEPGSDLAPPD